MPNLVGKPSAYSKVDELNAVTANQPGPIPALGPLCVVRRSHFHQLWARTELMSSYVPAFVQAYLAQPLSQACDSRVRSRYVEFLWVY